MLFCSVLYLEPSVPDQPLPSSYFRARVLLRETLGPVPPALTSRQIGVAPLGSKYNTIQYTTPTAHAAMALLAGFGPVVVACAMAPSGYFGECAAAFVSSKPEARGEMLTATFHVIVGTLFCSVSIALGCHMAY